MIERRVASIRRQQEFADDTARDFEADPLHITVHNEIIEDDQLAQLCDAAIEASIASDRREGIHGEDGPGVENLSEAWGRIAYVARQRALEVVAEACATVVQDGDQWIEEGRWNAETIHEAQAEAREWMQAHTNETNRANVEEVPDND
jgi:hypothetical protein